MHHSLVGRLLVVPALFLSTAASVAAQPASPAGAGAGTALTLEQAVGAVLARSPLHQMAAARLDASRIAASVAAVWPNPSIELRAENWTAGNWQWSPTSDPLRVPIDFFTVVTQPIELGGKRAARRGIAGSEQRSAEAELQRVDRMLALQAVRVYLDVVRNRELLAALSENQESLGALVSALDARVREGIAPASDLARFRAEAARITTQVVRTRIELERNAGLLGTLMGEPGFVDPVRVSAPLPPLLPDGDVDSLVTRIVEASPDVRAARSRASAAAEMSALERARRVPDLGVAGGYKRTAGVDTAVFGVLVTLPLFDQNRKGVALAAGDALATNFEARAIEERAAGEARVLVRHARLLAERAAQVDTDLVAPADVVRTAARAAFHEGAAEILTLVDAERLYVDAHREALQMKLDAVAAAFELRLMLGEEIHR